MEIGAFTIVEAFTNIEKQLKILNEWGFRSADVTDTHGGGQIGDNAGYFATFSLDANPFDIKRLFEKYEIRPAVFSMHGAILDPCYPQRYGTHEMMKAIKMASDIGIKYCITTEQEPITAWAKKQSYENQVYAVADKLYEPLRLAADYGIEVLLEPHGPLTDTVQGMRDIMNMLDNHPSLGINMDTGNSWLGGTDPVEMAKALKDKIKHVHWKDLGPEWIERRGKQFGCGFCTIPIGAGVIDIKGVCDVLRDCDIEDSTLEVYGDKDTLLESVRFLKEECNM
jgi:inosose dehydratase